MFVTFFIVILYIVPKTTDLKNLSQRAAAKQSELEVGRQQVAAIRTATQLIKAARADMDTLGVAIPDKEKAEEALQQLSANASSSEITIKSVTAGTGQAETGQSGALTITVSVSGDFSNTIAFIGNLEKNLRPVKVVDYSIVASGVGALTDTTFNLSFPYLVSSDEVAGGQNGQ